MEAFQCSVCCAVLTDSSDPSSSCCRNGDLWGSVVGFLQVHALESFYTLEEFPAADGSGIPVSFHSTVTDLQTSSDLTLGSPL